MFYKQVEARLKKLAIDGHAGYPQYAGYFDSWRLAEMRRQLNGYKGGSAFARKQIVLAREMETGTVLLYDPTLNYKCGAAADSVRFFRSPVK